MRDILVYLEDTMVIRHRALYARYLFLFLSGIVLGLVLRFQIPSDDAIRIGGSIAFMLIIAFCAFRYSKDVEESVKGKK
jgi:uncharacterized membrane protein